MQRKLDQILLGPLIISISTVINRTCKRTCILSKECDKELVRHSQTNFCFRTRIVYSNYMLLNNFQFQRGKCCSMKKYEYHPEYCAWISSTFPELMSDLPSLVR